MNNEINYDGANQDLNIDSLESSIIIEEETPSISFDNEDIELSFISEENEIGFETPYTVGGGGTKDHSQLKNLDFESSGHTGFQPAGNYALKDDIPTKISELENDKEFITNAANDLVNYYKKNEVYNKDEVDKFASELDPQKFLKGYATEQWVNDKNFVTSLANNLVNYYLKTETYSKEEINQIASSFQNVKIEVVTTKPVIGESNTIYFVLKEGVKTNDVYDEWIYINGLWENIGNTKVDLTGYATEDWVKDQEYMTIPDFQKYMLYVYYNKTEIDNKFKDYYNKEEIDNKLEELPTGGGTELTGGDNAVIEDNAINVYTNTGYKISDKDTRLQPIKASGITGTNKMVYTLDEVIIIYDGTNQIRRSENGIDFEIMTLPCACTKLVYNESNKRLYGTDNSSNFFYSDDNGLTWTLLPNNRASNVTAMAIGYGAGFRSIYRSSKEIIGWTLTETTNTLSMNTRITSTIYPDFTVMANDTQYIWCNSSGTFKYGAGTKEGAFASLSGITVNMLKRVNDITMIGLKNNDKMYILEPATSITAYKWIECSLPDPCTVNDIVFNPYDETYYLFTDINTYYKTKDLTDINSYESVNKDNLRGNQGYFTLMGIQAVNSEKNKLLLAPTRTTLENKAQEWDRILDKTRWVGDGLELVGEKINVKARSPLMSNSYGVGIGVLEEHHLPDFVIEGVYVAKAKEKDLFDPYEMENWYYGDEAYPEEQYKAVKFLFNQAGSFYNQVTWEEEYHVEQYEVGYLFYDQNMNIFKYVKLGNKSWQFE